MHKNADIIMVSTSGPWDPKLLSKNLGQSAASQCRAEVPPTCEFPFHAGTPQQRFEGFIDAQKKHPILWAIKGGYGASDLLPYLAETDLEPGRIIIGCSDVTALFPHLSGRGWHCVHAGMPGFSKFESNAAASLDLENLFKNAVKNWHGSIETVPFNSDSAEVTGRLFCGNLAVLTSLIGTPYFEPFKEPTILVIEDIGENPGRVIRAWTQWQQSGMLSNVSAVVLGRFTNMPGDNEKQEILIQGELRKRSPKLPFFVTGQVGHIAENYPLLVGSLATLRDNRLSWKA